MGADNLVKRLRRPVAIGAANWGVLTPGRERERWGTAREISTGIHKY
jgi:hypothetical protein